MLLEGLHIPLTTPFHPDGRLNLPKLAANVGRYTKTPAAGLIVLAGEPTLLTDDETLAALRTAAEAATPEKVLLANISRDSVRATVALAEHAATLHYDAVLIAPPSIAHDPREVLLYLQTVADRSPLPVALLGPIAVDTVVELAMHPNVLGLVDTTGDLEVITTILARTANLRRDVTVTPVFAAVTSRMKLAAARAAAPSLISISANTLTGGTAIAEPPPIAPALRTRTKSVGFQILATTPATLLDALTAGAVGIAAAFAACAPQATYEIFAAWKDADQPLAAEKQLRLTTAAEFAESLGPGGLKHGCDLNGYFGGVPRLPLLPPTGADREELEHLMQPMRN